MNLTTRQETDHHLNVLLHSDFDFDFICERNIDATMTMHAGSVIKPQNQ